MYVCAGSEGWINVVTLQREEKNPGTSSVYDEGFTMCVCYM